MVPFERPKEWWRAQRALIGSSKLLAIEWLAKNHQLTDQERDLLDRRALGPRVAELAMVATERAELLLRWPSDEQ